MGIIFFNMKFTCIIPYRHNEQRFNNLNRIIKWISQLDVELIIVEQDYKKHLNKLDNINYYFTKSDLPFNRSWALNVGLLNSTNNKIMFTDCDLIMKHDELIHSLSMLDNHDMISPYKSVIDLNNIESEYNSEDIFLIEREGRGGLNICGGITLFNKESILKIGGYDENFIGWGGEDDLQTIKVERFLNWKEMNYKCYHLYHDKSKIDKNFYLKNLIHLFKIKSYSNEDLLKYINFEKKSIGNINKY